METKVNPIPVSVLQKALLEGLQKKNHPKLADANADFILRRELELQFFGEFGLHLNFHEAPNMGTLAVNATAAGLNFYYDPKFIEPLEVMQVYFGLLHEYFHLIYHHPGRAKAISADPAVANVAMDCIINSTIREHYGKKVKEIKGALFLPKEYDGKPIFEDVYEWMQKVKEKLPKQDPQPGKGDGEGEGNGSGESEPKEGDGKGKGSAKGDGKGEPKDGDGSGKSKEMKDVENALRDTKNGGSGETFDKHLDDEVAEEIKRAMADQVIEGAKARGFGSAEIDGILEKLRKSKRDYIREIKRCISALKGSEKEKTFTRLDRRGVFGIRGAKRIGNAVNVIMDVSGSMYGNFETVLNTIYQDGIEVNIVQCDTKVKKHDVTKSKAELQKLHLNHGGGTELQPGVNYVIEKLNKRNTIVLTDGYCDNLDFNNHLGKVLILTTDKEVEITGGADKVKQIVIEKE